MDHHAHRHQAAPQGRARASTRRSSPSRAARQAIERARIDPIDIDLIICATVSPDQILPSTGCLIQAELGAHRAAAFDLAAACSGFLYGLTLANQMIRSGQTRYALVIGAEVLTRYVDYTDRSTCVLFGDGAGAAILGPAEGEPRHPRHAHPLRRALRRTALLAGRRHAHRPDGRDDRGGLHFFKMKGNELFKVAVRSMADVSREVLEEAGYKAEDVKLFIPHQANQRITDAVASRLNVDSSIVYSNIAYARQHLLGFDPDRARRVHRGGQGLGGRPRAARLLRRRRHVGRRR